MVTGVMLGFDRTFNKGQHVRQHGRSGPAGPPTDVGELVLTRLSHVIANALLILTQYVDTKTAGVANLRPTGRRLTGTEGHQGRVQ